MPPKISVIVPIYNVEEYLDKCLHSIRNQTLKDIEIICVDDCSPDGSHLIAERHIKEDPRVSLIQHEKNLGLGGARNTGIRAAKAEYVAGVDSDDYIKPEMFAALLDATENGKMDIVCCSFDQVSSSGEIIHSSNLRPKVLINDDNSINIFSTLNPAFWNKIWRRSLFIENQIFFPNHLYYEDLATTPRILSKSKYIKIINERLYRYLCRDESITNSYTPKSIFDYFKGFEIIYQFLEENRLVSRYDSEFYKAINSSLHFHSNNVINSKMEKDEISQYLIYLLMFKISFIEYRSQLKEIKDSDLLDSIGHDSTEIVKLGKTLKEIEGLKNKEVIKLKESSYEYKTRFEKNLKSQTKTISLLTEKNTNIVKKSNILKIEYIKLKKKNTALVQNTSNYKNTLETLQKKNAEALSWQQEFGVFLFGLLFRLFYTKKQSIKLKETPRRFFKDSKNGFTQMIGHLVNISS